MVRVLRSRTPADSPDQHDRRRRRPPLILGAGRADGPRRLRGHRDSLSPRNIATSGRRATPCGVDDRSRFPPRSFGPAAPPRPQLAFRGPGSRPREIMTTAPPIGGRGRRRASLQRRGRFSPAAEPVRASCADSDQQSPSIEDKSPRSSEADQREEGVKDGAMRQRGLRDRRPRPTT